MSVISKKRLISTMQTTSITDSNGMFLHANNDANLTSIYFDLQGNSSDKILSRLHKP